MVHMTAADTFVHHSPWLRKDRDTFDLQWESHVHTASNILLLIAIMEPDYSTTQDINHPHGISDAKQRSSKFVLHIMVVPLRLGVPDAPRRARAALLGLIAAMQLASQMSLRGVLTSVPVLRPLSPALEGHVGIVVSSPSLPFSAHCPTPDRRVGIALRLPVSATVRWRIVLINLILPSCTVHNHYVPERDHPRKEEGLYDDDVVEWTLDFPADVESEGLTPQLQQIKCPVRTISGSSTVVQDPYYQRTRRGIAGLRDLLGPRNCTGHLPLLRALCEVVPFRGHGCLPVHDPSSNGVSTECRTAAHEKDLGLLELEHPDFLAPRSKHAFALVFPPAVTAAIPLLIFRIRVRLLQRLTPSYTLTSLSESEEYSEDVPVSLPALVHARALQTRRRAPHPVSSVLGVRGALKSVARIGLCLVAVAGVVGSRLLSYPNL
ncbi:hypothetical protein FB451DRAFT_1376245 [Mycena latifolia]|nr:hypothetical protein FB451DRAFT_1376245 [Mycena latifolia]